MKKIAFGIGLLLAAVVLVALWAAPAQGESGGPLASDDLRTLRPSSMGTCERPTALTGEMPYSLSGTTEGGGDDYNLGAEGDCAGGGAAYQHNSTGVGEDDVFVIATDSDCPIAVSMDPADGVDLALYVLSPDCSDVAGNCVWVDDEGGVGTVEELEFPATAGQYYFIIVDGYDGAAGGFNLVVDSAESCELAYLYGSIGDRIWEDLNGDGIQDAGDGDITEGQVGLYQCGGALLQTMTLGGFPGYMFSDVMPGEYLLEFIPPAGTALSMTGASADEGVGRVCFRTKGPINH